MQTADLIWALVGFVLTLLVFSYLWGDNPIFRIVSYLFVGVSAGYLAVVVIYQVILPRLVWPLLHGTWEERLLVLIPLVLGLLLLTKITTRFAQLGSIPMAYLVGAGAAVAIGGAVVGTLVRQSWAAINVFDFAAGANQGLGLIGVLVESIIFLAGTVTTLAYFHYGAKTAPGEAPVRPRLIRGLAGIGQIFIAITLAAIFAGVYAASIAALIDRLNFIKTILVDVLLKSVF